MFLTNNHNNMKKILFALLLTISAAAHSQFHSTGSSANLISKSESSEKDTIKASIGIRLLDFHKEYSFGATVSAIGIAVALTGSAFASGPIIILGTAVYLGGQAIIIDSHKYFKSIGKILDRDKSASGLYLTN